MKATAKELGWIIVSLAAIALVIGMITLFRFDIGAFFQNIVFGETEIADKVLTNVDGGDLVMDDPNDPGTAYAIYSADDKSLTFVRSKNKITDGDMYNGRVVTSVYTGFESNTYSAGSAPWYSICDKISTVVIQDEINPISTAYWFYQLGSCSNFDLFKLNTSKVTDMTAMFCGAGEYAKSFNVSGLSDWDVSNVTSMSKMFMGAGSLYANSFNIGDLGRWDTSCVIDMSFMFNSACRHASVFNIGDLSGWDTSCVTDMSHMFKNAGESVTTWNVGNLGNWNTSKVTDMSYMFDYAGFYATVFDAGDLGNWNTSNVTNMEKMFCRTAGGFNLTSFNIGNLRYWDTSNVTNMSFMFYFAGQKASYFINLSGWNVDNVTSHLNFNGNVESKVRCPVFSS